MAQWYPTARLDRASLTIRAERAYCRVPTAFQAAGLAPDCSTSERSRVRTTV